MRIHEPEGILRLRVALCSQRSKLVERQIADRLLRLGEGVGVERGEGDQDGGQGDDAGVMSRYASSNATKDDIYHSRNGFDSSTCT